MFTLQCLFMSSQLMIQYQADSSANHSTNKHKPRAEKVHRIYFQTTEYFELEVTHKDQTSPTLK